ncbi:MAG: regulatory signaling modulator protein AmpE [Moraxellaceae bacterium]|nr:regulatory signaling modulator protein AmpE [Moraxellaceae bacterium]MDZ4387944.1 regulatory signaling modulator protein AmpE [Moraxellaceae bacterium]
MSLLLALIALAAYFAMPDDWRRLLSQPGQSWLRLMESLPAALPAPVRLALVIVLPMLVLLVLIQGLREVGLSLLVFLPAAIVLVIVFSDVSLPRALERFAMMWQRQYAAPEDADKSDIEHLSATVIDDQHDWVTDEVTLDAELHQARTFLLRESLHELFSPLFWFLLAGPVAALGYYLLRLMVGHAREEARQIALSWLHIADWIPTRLLSISFALAGNFTATWAVIREQLLKSDANGHELIDVAAQAAEPEGLDDDIESAHLNLTASLTRVQALIQRSLIVWMVFLALKTLWPGF